MNLKAALAIPALLVGVASSDCWAWGATVHEWISGIAIEKLPDTVPAFVRTPEVAAEIAIMGRELDRSKGAGKIHDAERDPGHYVDLGDNGEVMGVVPLAKLPRTREAYDTELRAKGFTQYQAGYLPYSIVDGGQQVRKDFAYWRALTKAIETAATPEERTWFEADRRLREKLTIHDIGIWSHYVGDGSQPCMCRSTSIDGATSRTPTATRTARRSMPTLKANRKAQPFAPWWRRQSDLIGSATARSRSRCRPC